MVVVREAVQHLVDDLELCLAQEIGAPEDDDRASQLLLVRGELGRIDGAVALVEQIGDLEFPQPSALPPDFCRMRGEDRADQGGVEELLERLGLDAHFARALEGKGERTGPRRGARDEMRAVAADVVLILGNVGEMREIAVGAHDRERLVGAQAVERGLELAPGAGFIIAMESDRGAANLLDQLEHLLALLLAHRIAEDAAEQPNVLAQRTVFGSVVVFGESGFEGHLAHP